MKTLTLTLFACSMAACAVDQLDDGAVATDEQPIIGGTTDTGDPSVVAIFAHAPGSNSGSLCTGTVIASRTVLTAAHCVDPAVVGSGQVFEVLTGTTLSLPGLAASDTAFDPQFDINNLTAGHDIGVVHLATPTTLAPIPFSRDHTLNANLPVRLVGYGTNTHKNTGAGTKREVTTVIDSFDNLLVQIGTSKKETCHGDSGGPAFQTLNGVETLIGTTSFGFDRSARSVCFGGGFDTRVDAVLAFIDANTL